MAEKRDGVRSEVSSQPEDKVERRTGPVAETASTTMPPPADERRDAEAAGETGRAANAVPVEPGERGPIPGRELLFEMEGVRVYASLVSDQAPVWHLEVNGLVIPLGPSAGTQGELARSVQKLLGEKRWLNLREALRGATGRKLEPHAPVQVRLDDELGPALLPNAPEVPAAARWRPDVEPVRYQAIAVTVAKLTDVEQVGQVAGEVVQTAARHGVWRLALPMLGTGRGPFQDQKKQVAQYMVRGVHNALCSLTEGAIGEITLTTRDEGAFEEMRRKANALTNTLPQRLVSDEPKGRDLLAIRVEARALAEALLLEGVEPPLAVGILGGWGSGKTFVMELMRRRMMEIRGYGSRGWPPDSKEWPARTYIGHVYLIGFNAWTYAKSNLWASLMQTIFFELNRQLTMERQLVEALTEVRLGAEGWTKQETEARQARKEGLMARVWREDNDLWPALYATGEGAQRLLLETELGQKVLAEWQAGRVHADALWDYLQNATEDEMKRLDELRTRLAGKREALDTEIEREKARQTVDPVIEKEVAWVPVRDRLKAVLAESVWDRLQTSLGKEDADTLAELSKLRPDVRSTWRAVRQRPWEVAAFVAFAGVAALVPLALSLPHWQLPTAAIPVLATVAAWGRVALRLQGTLGELREEYQAALEAERAKLRAAEDAPAETGQIKALRGEVAGLEAEVRQQEERVGLTARYLSLHDFVRSRLEERYYEKQLGLMHRVECDLNELTEKLYIRRNDPPEQARLKRELLPRGQPRIVLFIDDLDRCPPNRVVEVLEAVQLLLKTELFVVILGLDTRYVTRALEKAYEGILAAEDEPSGLDYIEKILTLPYRVRPVPREAVAGYLKGQRLEVLAGPEQEETVSGEREREGGGEPPAGGDLSVREPGGAGPADRSAEVDRRMEERAPLEPEVVAFEQAEYEALETVCQEVMLTPRSLKRITNVMKLVKIFWHRSRVPASPEKVRAVAALLALSARYPEVMRDAFVALGLRYRQADSGPQGVGQAWQEFFAEFVEVQAPRNQHVRVWGKQFVTDARATMAGGMRLDALDPASFNLARSFSFVGDPTPAVEPAMKVEVVERKQAAEGAPVAAEANEGKE